MENGAVPQQSFQASIVQSVAFRQGYARKLVGTGGCRGNGDRQVCYSEYDMYEGDTAALKSGRERSNYRAYIEHSTLYIVRRLPAFCNGNRYGDAF